MMLMQEPTKIETDPRAYLTGIHGTEGVGKTSYGQQIPGHYFMITEAGTEGVEVYGDPILTWEEYLAKCKEIVEAKQNNFKEQREIKVVVIDTVEKLWDLCGYWVCANCRFPEKGIFHKFDRIEDVPFGKGYKRINELLIATFNKLMLYGLGVLWISHTKERTITWGGQDMTAVGPNLGPTAADYLVAASGAVGYIDIESVTKKDESGSVISVEEGRVMWWQKSFLRTAKHRLDHFPDKLTFPKGKGYITYLRAFEEAVEKRKQELKERKTEHA